MSVEHGCSSRRIVATTFLVLCVCVAPASGQAPSVSTPFDNSLNIPDVRAVLPTADSSEGVSATLQIFVLLTVLALVPSVLVMMTAFPRVIVVLALLRQAVGTPQLPPGQVLLGMSLFLTAMIMAPTWHRIQTEAVSPYFDNQIGQSEALEVCAFHMKEFMYRQIEKGENEEDIYLFLEYSEQRAIDPEEQITVDDCPMTVMIPAFMLSELKTAFIMGFRIYLPFLVIDMVIAMILISMGMMMLPPVLISLPFKIMLFVLADGWHLVVETLLYSFAPPL